MIPCAVCNAPVRRSHCVTCSAECRRIRDERERLEIAAKRAERYSHNCAVCGVRFVRHSFQVQCCGVACGVKYRLRAEARKGDWGKGSGRTLGKLCGLRIGYVPPVGDTGEWSRIFGHLETMLPIDSSTMCHLTLNAVAWADERRLVEFDGKYWRKRA